MPLQCSDDSHCSGLSSNSAANVKGAPSVLSRVSSGACGVVLLVAIPTLCLQRMMRSGLLERLESGLLRATTRLPLGASATLALIFIPITFALSALVRPIPAVVILLPILFKISEIAKIDVRLTVPFLVVASNLGGMALPTGEIVSTKLSTTFGSSTREFASVMVPPSAVLGLLLMLVCTGMNWWRDRHHPIDWNELFERLKAAQRIRTLSTGASEQRLALFIGVAVFVGFYTIQLAIPSLTLAAGAFGVLLLMLHMTSGDRDEALSIGAETFVIALSAELVGATVIETPALRAIVSQMSSANLVTIHCVAFG